METTVKTYTRENAGGLGRETRKVKNCPYTPEGGCFYTPEIPREFVCGDNECWLNGTDVQNFLAERDAWPPDDEKKLPLIKQAQKYAREQAAARRAARA